MNSSLILNGFGWGFALWLFGYVLGFVFYEFITPALIGWYVMPLGIAANWLRYETGVPQAFLPAPT